MTRKEAIELMEQKPILVPTLRSELEALLREANALLNSSSITFRLPAVPWRDRRDAWNKAFEKVKL